MTSLRMQAPMACILGLPAATNDPGKVTCDSLQQTAGA
jgi:hypothetical protein